MLYTWKNPYHQSGADIIDSVHMHIKIVVNYI